MIAIEVNISIMRAFVAVRQLVSALPVNDITRLQDEIKELKEYVEAAFADYNDINEDTRMQLELINQAIAELQAKDKQAGGKTTFLNALSQYIPDDERIITIEDSAELQLLGAKNIVRLETRNANTDGVTPITIRDLIRTALRMRPDRIIVGECRGAEALDMLQAIICTI